MVAGGIYFYKTLLSAFGASIVVVVVYIFPITYLALFHMGMLLKAWRFVTIGLCLSIAIIIVMGIVPPLKSFGNTGESLGGTLSIILAREPFYWNQYNYSNWHLAQAFLRIIIVLGIGSFIVSPKKVASIGKFLFRNFVQNSKKVKSIYNLVSIAKSKILDSRAKTKSNKTTNQQIIPEQKHLKIDDIDEETLDVWNDDPKVKRKKAPINDYSSVIKFNWEHPDLNLLEIAPIHGINYKELEETSILIEKSLEQHGIEVTVDSDYVKSGPTVTMYGLKPGWKGNSQSGGQRVRVDAILNREKDLALALATPSLRFEAPVPGESVVGIEVPNKEPKTVTMRSVIDTDEWKKFQKESALPVPLGIGTGGNPIMCDLARMPHTLIAGSTGSGKSVCMNSIITGLTMSLDPTQVRLVMLDPKRVELTPYQGIPHLYTDVVVDTERAVTILRSMVDEMMSRFKLLEGAGVKNIASYNAKTNQRMPYLVVLVDELADLMLTAAGEVERLLVRLAQLGRATGVHLVVATQRPSVDVVTGLIKANFPSRISFSVMSQIDSRTILDTPGAEKLLGRGDMLYMPVDASKPYRVQGMFLSDREIEAIVGHWISQSGPDLPELVVTNNTKHSPDITSELSTDSLYERAADLAESQRTLSVSLLQRRLRIGYPRAARLMDELEDTGIVGQGEPGKPRPVL